MAWTALTTTPGIRATRIRMAMGGWGRRSGCFGTYLIGLEGLGTSALPKNVRSGITSGGDQGWDAGDRGARVQRDEDWGLMRDGAEQRMFLRFPGNVANTNAWSPNALIKQGLS
jgi:hypothetical protein